MALLDPREASQLPDRAALRSIIETLRSLGHAQTLEGRLHGTPSLRDLTRHASLTLPSQARLALSHAAQRPVEEILAAQAAAQPSPAKRRR